MTIPETLTYSGLGAVALLFVSFAVFPKRTRKTVDYILDTVRAARQVKEGDPTKPVEVRNFETISDPMPAVPNPRAKEPQS